MVCVLDVSKGYSTRENIIRQEREVSEKYQTLLNKCTNEKIVEK